MLSKPDVGREALAAGALGYVTKDSSPDVLQQALRAVSDGLFYIDSSIARDFLLSLGGDPKLGGIANIEYGPLSDRERQVLRPIAEGLLPLGISAKLFIGVRTVGTHRANILNKLGSGLFHRP
jgi:DNA-binding NarL/FixJ family response regulator